MSEAMAAGQQALILAAGVGKRLRSGETAEHPPKALLRFGAETLIARHVRLLRQAGIDAITVVVGYRAAALRAELEGLGAPSVATIGNPEFETGSVVSLLAGASVLRSGERVVLMDADVIYDRRLMARLTASRLANTLLLDRALEAGDEPVKICLDGKRIVDFRKRPEHAGEWRGESVGFFRLAPDAAAELAARASEYVAGGRGGLDYEEPIRDMMLASPDGRFGVEDITGLPWTEIDFSADVERARALLPQLAD